MDGNRVSNAENNVVELSRLIEKAAGLLARVFVSAVLEELFLRDTVIGQINGSGVGTSVKANEAEKGGTSLVFSVKEAAKMMGISANTAYNLVKSNQIPCVRWGKRYLVPRAALMKMLTETGGGSSRT